MTTQLIHLRDFQPLTDWQYENIREFTRAIDENFLFRLVEHTRHVPSQHDIWFFLSGPTIAGMLWTEPQQDENSHTTLRVHALHIDPYTSSELSRKVTRIFEKEITNKAKALGIKRLGFYTRRNPHAFMRRLNRTTPPKRKWKLDSYVLTRPV